MDISHGVLSQIIQSNPSKVNRMETSIVAYYGKKLKTASRQTRTNKVTRVRSTDINCCVFFFAILYA